MATNRMKKSEAVHRLWELADSEEAIIYLSDCLFVYLSGEERMEDTLNRASTQYNTSSSPKLQLKQFSPKKGCLPSFSLKLKLSLLAQVASKVVEIQ